MIRVNTSQLNPLFCPRHDVEYDWDGKILEKGCEDKKCGYCKDRPEKITEEYCLSCNRREGCISWNARQLGR